jgi:hypothetical protein
MLPTEDSPPYLYSYFNGSAYPQGHEVNSFLQSLNANIGLLVSRIGVGNIYVLAGRGAPETDRRYRVLPHLLGNLWRYGSVPSVLGVSPFVEEWTEGDDLIPTKSATLDYSGLVGLPPGNEQILDAAPDPGGARHSPLMHHDQVQRKWVPTFLADLELPFKTDYVVPDLIPSQGIEVLLVSIACPANIMITDPDGHRLGYDPVTQTAVNEISSSTYLSPGVEPQLLWIGKPKTGRYEVRITGWPDVGADPSYLVRADRVGVGGTVGPIIAVAGATAPLQEDTFTFDLVPNEPPTADAGPDQTVAAGPDCTARVTLDGSGSSDPDGDTLHYAWESDFGTTYEGVRPTLDLPLGSHAIRLTVDDGKGQVSRDSVDITVEDRTPPTITVRDHITAEQTSLAGTPVSLPDPVVTDNCSLPSVSNDAPATFPLGSTLVTYTAVDAAGNVAKATTTVVVRDTTPPVLANVPAPVTVEQEGPGGTRVVLRLPMATDICDAAPLVTSDAPAIFPLGRTTVTFTAVDASGNLATARTTVTVTDTTPPVLSDVPAPIRVEQTHHHGTPVRVPLPKATDICDADPKVTSDAPPVFPLGQTTVRFTAVDRSGNVATAQTKVTVVDTTPPAIKKLFARPSWLWPPNHRMVSVKVVPVVFDICDVKPRCRITSVTSSDPVTGKGDHTSPDWRVTGDLSLELRAERDEGGSGRTYTITVACTDDSGNSSSRKVRVRVRHHGGGDDDHDDDDHADDHEGRDHRGGGRKGDGGGGH